VHAATDHLQRAAAVCYDADAPFWEARARSDLDHLAS